MGFSARRSNARLTEWHRNDARPEPTMSSDVEPPSTSESQANRKSSDISRKQSIRIRIDSGGSLDSRLWNVRKVF